MPDERFVVSANRPTYSVAPTPVLDAVRKRTLPLDAIGIYVFLDSYRNRKTGQCDPGLRLISEDAGRSVPTVRKVRDALVTGGFVQIRKPNNPAKPDEYILLYSPQWSAQSLGEARATGLHTKPSARAKTCAKTCATASCTELYKQDKQEGEEGIRPDDQGSEKKAESKPTVHKIVEDWHDTYKSVVGQKPMITGKQVAILHRMIAHYGEEVLGEMIGNFFHPKGRAVSFTVENFYNLGDKLYQEVKGRVYGGSKSTK